jgi:hypothetical protein
MGWTVYCRRYSLKNRTVSAVAWGMWMKLVIASYGRVCIPVFNSIILCLHEEDQAFQHACFLLVWIGDCEYFDFELMNLVSFRLWSIGNGFNGRSPALARLL